MPAKPLDRIQMFLAGAFDISDLDDEELQRGYPRERSGKFGKAPKLIPREIHNEAVKRLLTRGDSLWRESYLQCIKVFRDIAEDDKNSATDRLKAAQYLIERVAGKTPERIHIAAEDPVEALFARILNSDEGLLPHEPSADERIQENGEVSTTSNYPFDKPNK